MVLGTGVLLPANVPSAAGSWQSPHWRFSMKAWPRASGVLAAVTPVELLQLMTRSGASRTSARCMRAIFLSRYERDTGGDGCGDGAPGSGTMDGAGAPGAGVPGTRDGAG